MTERYQIRILAAADLVPAMALAWRVFLQFEAPEYKPEGIKEFQDYIDPVSIAGMRTRRELLLWGCFDGGGIVGILAAKPLGHISLLFVDPAYHRQGIAAALFQKALVYCRKREDCADITVNASPYGVPAYRRLGFSETGAEQEVNGLRFTPMKYLL